MTLIDKAEALALFAADENVPTQLVRDALNALPARGVGVKPLVWQPIVKGARRPVGLVLLYRKSVTAEDKLVAAICKGTPEASDEILLGKWRDGAWRQWNTGWTVNGVTHWMPLPEPPEILAALAPTDAAHVNETPKTEHDGADVLTAAQARAPFFFDRYVNGVLMAEGVCIERETTLEGAMQAAARIAAKGPNGEAPVLVYRARAALTTEADNDRQA